MRQENEEYRERAACEVLCCLSTYRPSRKVQWNGVTQEGKVGCMADQRSRSPRSLLQYVACYAIWLSLSLLGAYVVVVWRSTAIAVAVRMWDDVWSISLVGQLATIFLALGWLVFVIALEPYLRTGVARNRLWSRAAKVLVIGVVLLVLAYFL